MFSIKKAVMMAYVMSFSLYAISDETEKKQQRQLSFVESTLVGAATGASEVPLGRAFDSLKAKMVNDKISFLAAVKFFSKQPWQLWAGTSVHLASTVPTTVFQTQVKSTLAKVFDPVTASGLAGACSTLLVCPLEAFILMQQQNPKLALLSVAKLFGAKGLKNLYRGAFCIGSRESIFSVGYMYLAQRVNEGLKQYVDNQWVARPLSAVMTGMPLAVVSHPCETVRMWQQRSNTALAWWHVLAEMHQSKDGLAKELFRGAVPRGARYCFALGGMGYAYEKTSAWMKNKNKQ